MVTGAGAPAGTVPTFVVLVVGVLMVLIVGLDRLMLGVHTLTEVAAGYALGVGVGLPDMKCPAGTYLHNANYSPGRLVPHGVQVVEPGGVGVSMSGATLAATQPKGLPLGVQVYDATTGPSSATNWDLSSHPLVINIVCTTNPWDAVYYDPYHVWG